MSTSLITVVIKRHWAVLILEMGERLSSRPGTGCMWLGIFFRHQTFINPSALVVALMALQLAYVNQKTFRPSFMSELHRIGSHSLTFLYLDVTIEN